MDLKLIFSDFLLTIQEGTTHDITIFANNGSRHYNANTYDEHVSFHAHLCHFFPNE